MAEPLSPAELEVVRRFDAAPSAPESFDAVAAIRRVMALCDVADDQPDGYECQFIATRVIRDAVNGSPS